MIVSETELSILHVMKPPYVANPYPLYHRLREAEPVHWDSSFSWGVVTRHADVMAVLRDDRISAARGDLRALLPADARERLDRVGYTFMRQLLFLDLPEHTRLHKLLSGAFTPRMVVAMRTRIEALVDELLAGPRRTGRMDLIPACAYPLPVIVIVEMLGVPAADRAQFAVWSQRPETLLSGVPLSDVSLVEAFEQVEALMEYMRCAVARHRQAPAEICCRH